MSTKNLNPDNWPRIRDLPEKEQAPFRKALGGQTVPLVTAFPAGDQDFYFPWDYERWKKGLPVID